MAAKQIIILETFRGTGLGDTTVHFVFWFPIAVARQVPNATFVSVYRGVTGPETTALQSGAVIEERYDIQAPPGTTAAQVKALLQARYTARSVEIAALPNVNQFYGTFWDGAVWV